MIIAIIIVIIALSTGKKYGQTRTLKFFIGMKSNFNQILLLTLSKKQHKSNNLLWFGAVTRQQVGHQGECNHPRPAGGTFNWNITNF